VLLYPNEGFLEQRSSTTVGEKNKIRVQNDDFAGNGKSQDEFLKNIFRFKFSCPIFYFGFPP
jgi:hypothetical protein